MEIHGGGILHEARRHLCDVLVALGVDGLHPIGRRGLPGAVDAGEQSGDAGADIAHQRRGDLDVRVHFLGLDVDLDELLGRIAPGLALAVGQQPVEAGAHQNDHVGILQRRGARGTGGLGMGVGQKALGHAHGQEGNAALLDEFADRLVGLGIGRALAEDDQGTLGALEHLERALHRIRTGI